MCILHVLNKLYFLDREEITQLSKNTCDCIHIFFTIQILIKCFHIIPLALLLFMVVPMPPTEGPWCCSPPAATSMVPDCLFITPLAYTG